MRFGRPRAPTSTPGWECSWPWPQRWPCCSRSVLRRPTTPRCAFLVVTYSTVVVFALVGHLLGRSFDEERRLSITDPLTGLYNRRYFGQRLSEETKRAQRYGHAASVLCVDVDRLKAINDDFGHSAGDGALVAVGRALATTCAPSMSSRASAATSLRCSCPRRRRRRHRRSRSGSWRRSPGRVTSWPAGSRSRSVSPS